MTDRPAALQYTHVDVFSKVPFSGNSLPVFTRAADLSAEQMLRITQELRHFEAIFVLSPRYGNVRARVFDLFEELPFAGHPVIGAAAALHDEIKDKDTMSWEFELPARTVNLTSERTPIGYFALLDQGPADFLGRVSDPSLVLNAFGLSNDDVHPSLPAEVVSTGLRYLIIPVRHGALDRARVQHDLSALLGSVGAQFAVLLDDDSLEIRHWNNDGVLEDVATGSAAGTIGAYRVRHGSALSGETFVLRQGRFAGRPSELQVQAEGDAHRIDSVKVGGAVSVLGHGRLEVLP